MHLRTYTPADVPAIREIFRQAVLILGRQAYSEMQTQVWAERIERNENFERSLAAGLTMCATVEDQPVAFGALNPIEHVSYLYCSPPYARHGYATAILQALEAHARAADAKRLHTEASCVARPCFERFGFEVIEEERVMVSGIELLRYKMAKIL